MRLFVLANIAIFGMVSAVHAQASATSATTDPAVNEGLVSPEGFKVGETTIDAVQAKLGRPISMLTNSDGTKVAVYSKTKTKVKGSSFIPLVGMFTAGAKATISTKSYTFDQRGTLKSFSASETTTDCHSSVTGFHCQ